MQTLGEKQQTLATLDMSVHEIEDVDMYKQSIIQYITLIDYNYAWLLLFHVQD